MTTYKNEKLKEILKNKKGEVRFDYQRVSDINFRMVAIYKLPEQYISACDFIDKNYIFSTTFQHNG